jgi:hypothetical protein
MRVAILAGLLTVSVVTARAAAADEIVLKSGAVLTGQATARGDQVEIRMDIGTVSVPRSEVAEIRTGESDVAELERRKRAINYADVNALRTLAEWADARGMRARATELWRAVSALSPHDVRARERLGQRQHQGRWLSEEEWYVETGHVRWGGEWVTREIAEERTRALEERRKQRQEEAAAREARANEDVEEEPNTRRRRGPRSRAGSLVWSETLLAPDSSFEPYGSYLEAVEPLYFGPGGFFPGTYYFHAPSPVLPYSPQLTPHHVPALPLQVPTIPFQVPMIPSRVPLPSAGVGP